MSLIRQVWLLLLGVILLACATSVAVSVWTARDYLETQLTLKNHDNAQALALALTQQGGDLALLKVVVAAQFDTGHYRRIALRADGTHRACPCGRGTGLVGSLGAHRAAYRVGTSQQRLGGGGHG